MGNVKTTLDLADELLRRAKRYARSVGKPLRAVVEDGLRLVLQAESRPASYRLPDRSVGRRGGSNPLESLSSQDLRDEIYGSSAR